MGRVMEGYHPEIWKYVDKVVTHTNETYMHYLREVGSAKVYMMPRDKLDQTDIESRIEKRFRALLLNCMPGEIREQCMYTDTVTSAQILYRAITHAGPANKADREVTMDLLIKARTVEVTKLY